MTAANIAKVALEAATYAIDRPYDYSLPPDLAKRVLPGMRVVVPFGAGNRSREGFVLALRQESALPKLKPVLHLLDEAPVLDEQALRLALWMRERCFCTVYDAARAMLPAGLWYSLRDCYRVPDGISKESAYEAAGRSEAACRVLDLVYGAGGSAEAGHIKAAFGVKDPNPALRDLTSRGVLRLETEARQGVRDKTELIATLLVPPEDAMAQVTAKCASAPRRYAVVELLCRLGSASSKEIRYFTGASNATLRSLSKSGLISLERQAVYRRVTAQTGQPPPPTELTPDQQAAFDGLDALCVANKPAAALLYGVTGSGKTQIYLKLIQSVLARGRTAMLLVPEIALTPQLIELFVSCFGDKVAVSHSALRAGERYDEWKRLRAGEAKLAIGTRSAVFSPLKNLGIIILDEEQEFTYKSEQNPRYHARDIAKFRCIQNNALLLLGSATPSVETMYQAQEKVYHLFTLDKRYNEHSLPRVEIVDMKRELREGNSTGISAPLLREIEDNLERGEQSILFLNRRGASRMVSCGECGHVPMCPRCSIHLTYHSANGRLMCHYCGHSERLPEYCSKCEGRLNFIGTGTQRLEEELSRLLPDVEVLRMDADTISALYPHERILRKFTKKKIPILLGTQMVAKGLDFENVTLVGVIDADLSLYLDSFRAAERTFSLLTQVVGRAGRGDKTGRAVIQTWTPDNDVIRLAAAQDYDGFYRQELAMRRLRGFPPFSDLILVTAAGRDEEAVLRTCLRMRNTLEHWLAHPPYDALSLQILGPAPAAIAKINNRYRYRLTLWGQNTKQLRAVVAHLLRTVQSDRASRGVSVFADSNPMD